MKYNKVVHEAIGKLIKAEDQEVDEAIDFSSRAPRPIVRPKEKVFIFTKEATFFPFYVSCGYVHTKTRVEPVRNPVLFTF